jgi:hypothetical protein
MNQIDQIDQMDQWINGSMNQMNWAEPSRAADADDNPRDQAVGSHGSQLPNQTQVLQTIPDSVPETPNSAPEANQNLALEPNTLALQARTLLGNQNSFPQTSKTWAQQLAREEAAELRERVRNALAKAIAGSSRPDLDQADPLPVPTTGGSPGGGSTAPISTKPGSAAASQPLNQTLANPKGLANQNMVPQTNPNSVPQTSNTLAHQANPIKQLPNNDFLKVIQAEPLPVAGTLMCQISTGLDVWQVVRRFLYLRSGRLR